jgi:hypothetical protein
MIIFVYVQDGYCGGNYDIQSSRGKVENQLLFSLSLFIPMFVLWILHI